MRLSIKKDEGYERERKQRNEDRKDGRENNIKK